MTLLDRYVGREFLRLFLLFVLAAPVLFIIGDLTEKIDRHLDRGLTTTEVALGYLYMTPQFVLWSVPIAALIATVFTVSNMGRHSEVSAAKAGGVSFFRLFAPLPVLGFLITVATLGLSEVVPVATRMKADILQEKSMTRTARSNFVYRAEDGRVFAIRRLDVERGEINGLHMEWEGDEPRVPGEHLSAESANYTAGEGWTLHNGYMRLLLGPGEERTFRFAALAPRDFDAAPEQLLAVPKDPEEMRYAELGRFIDVIQRSGGRPLELRVKQAQKIALPVATFIIILFAMPLAVSSARGGAAYGIGISMGITVVYLMLFKITGAAGAAGAVSPLVGAWFPNALFLAAAALFMVRVRT
jgi:lipopolysaccharide export system permease protein